MKYFYAVIEFDSKETALYVYRQCDGMEMERTSNKFDMRFIPDDTEFDPRQIPKDETTEVPVDYKAPSFYTTSLQHSNVKLTWDEDDHKRVQITRSKFTKDQLNEMDFRAYLASSSSESEESDKEQSKKKAKKKKIRNKYKSILEEITPQAEEKDDMEVTFTPGLGSTVEGDMEAEFEAGGIRFKDAVNRRLAANSDMTVWDEYLRKRSEKKKQKKQRKSQNNAGEEEDEDEDEDDLIGKRKKPNKKQQKEEEEKKKAELELLLMSKNPKLNKKSSRSD